MYKLNKIVAPRSVIWAKKSIYYDKPELSNPDKTSMFLVTYVNEDYFFGCPLTMNPSPKNSTVLLKSHYPLKRDSRVNEYLYKLTGQDIVSDELFKITRGTFEYFKRCLYQRIALGHAESPEEYNDIFVEEYLKDYRPTVNNIVVYPSAEKVFRYYYVAGETEKDYLLLKLNKNSYNNFSLIHEQILPMSKSVRFYDYYTSDSLIDDPTQITAGKVYIKK